jgi:hypothetical protein
MIKLTNENVNLVQDMLDRVNGRATTHCYTLAAQIYDLADAAEAQLGNLGIAKTRRAGASYAATSGSALPSSYKYSAKATWVKLTRRAAGWYLADCSATEIRPGSPPSQWLTLTPDQDAAAVKLFREAYHVAR